MKIQIISNKSISVSSKHTITRSTFNKPFELDAYDINIISLQYENIWKCEENISQYLDITNDFKSILQMIVNSKTSVNIIALPQNYKHYYYKSVNGGYYNHCELKDELQNLQKNLLASILPQQVNGAFKLIYENSETIIENTVYESAFSIMSQTMPELTKTKGGDKITTASYNKNFIITTLNLPNADERLDTFIKAIGLDKEREELPQWVADYSCFDDDEQHKFINDANAEIAELNKKIEHANIKLCENLKYKSILSTNGDELVSVVFEILEKILCCDLSGFVDEGKQDFLIKKENVTFIGEIKGITSNVKSENVSQLDVHYQSYLEELGDSHIAENVKALLIINPFRTKPILEREKIHENQIALAKRNDSLIITTEVLLKIFEKFQNGEISGERIVSLFSAKSGLLTLNDLYSTNKKVDNRAYIVGGKS
ncbi:MAG: hypothetical protein IJA41_00025 [Clostridia bacterium]|nr:hypothetical protein [Clostridia bacterium]